MLYTRERKCVLFSFKALYMCGCVRETDRNKDRRGFVSFSVFTTNTELGSSSTLGGVTPQTGEHAHY